MKLAEILALHPQGADAATLREAIAKAEALRVDLITRAGALEHTRSEGLLRLEEKALIAAQTEAATARLDAERIAALLPAMRAELHQAEGREALAALRAEAEDASKAISALEDWLRDELPKIPPLLTVGFQLEDAATNARQRLLDKIMAAYGRQAVRDAGALEDALPPLPDRRPRALFSGWS